MNKLKLMTVIGTRPEIIRLSAVIKKCDKYFDQILVHTGQNYDYTLNQIFFEDLGLRAPDFYLDAVGKDLGETIGNIIAKSYALMAEQKPDALLILGDTNSCLCAIGAKRLHIPIFHMEAGNRCFDECLPEETNRRIVDHIADVNMCYSEHARRYLNAEGTAKERTFVTGSPMAEVLHANLAKIEASDVLKRLGLEPHQYMLLSAHREENIDTEKNFLDLFTSINRLAETYDMPILYSCHPRSRKRLEAMNFRLDPRVKLHEPLGFHDYNHLQMNAFCVVSRFGHAAGGVEFLFERWAPFPRRLHPHLHRAAGSPGQGLLCAGRHRRGRRGAGGGHRRGHAPKRRRRHPGALLHRGCLQQGGQDHPELHRRGQQDGVAQGLTPCTGGIFRPVPPRAAKTNDTTKSSGV